MRTEASHIVTSNFLRASAQRLASLHCPPTPSGTRETQHLTLHLRRLRRRSFARLTRSASSNRRNIAPISTAVCAMPARHTCAALTSLMPPRRTTSSLPTACARVICAIPNSKTLRSPGSTSGHSAICQRAVSRHTLISCAQEPEKQARAMHPALSYSIRFLRPPRR